MSYGNNEDAGDLGAANYAGYCESQGEDKADAQAAHYAEWLQTREGWAKSGHASDDLCEEGCDKPLTPENIAVSNDGWFCEDCAERRDADTSVFYCGREFPSYP